MSVSGSAVGPLGGVLGSRFPPLDEVVHPPLGVGGHLDLLSQQAEDLVDARRFGEVDVRRQAFLLVDGDLVGLEIVVEVARHQVGIGGVGAVFARNRQPTLPGHPMNPLHQFLGQRAVGDLLADLAHLHRRQRVVEPGQEGSQSESHRFIVSPSPSMRRPPDRPGLLKPRSAFTLYVESGRRIRARFPKDFSPSWGRSRGRRR